MSTISRFGNLGKVFKEGESELLNAIARLSILYEDLRLELGDLQTVNRKRVEGEVGGEDEYRVMYFLRRGLVTLIEFVGSALARGTTGASRKPNGSNRPWR